MFACVELHDKATWRVAEDFLGALIRAALHKVHTVLAGHGIPFTAPSDKSSTVRDIKLAVEHVEPSRAHAFESACARACHHEQVCVA